MLRDQNALSRAGPRLQRRVRARAPSRARVAPDAGVWGGGARRGAQLCRVGPGRQSGVPGLLPRSSSERRLSAHDAHQPRLAFRPPQPDSAWWAKGKERKNKEEKKGRARRKLRVRLEGADWAGVPASSSARLGGSPRKWKMSGGGKGRKSVEEERRGRLRCRSLPARGNPAKVALSSLAAVRGEREKAEDRAAPRRR